MLNVIDERCGQRVAVNIGVVGENAVCRDDKRRVLVGRIAVGNSPRRVVDRCNVDGNGIGRRVECASAVLHREGEAGIGRAIVVGVRCESDIGDVGKRDYLAGCHVIRAKLQRASARQRVDPHGLHTVAGIGVREAEIGSREASRSILVQGDRGVGPSRRVVDAGDCEGDGGGGAVHRAVIDGVGEAVGGGLPDGQIVVHAVRIVAVAAVGLNGETCARDQGDRRADIGRASLDFADAQRVAGIGVGVVEQDVAGDLRGFIARKRVIDRYRRIVDRADIEGDGCGGAVHRAVIDGVAETVGAVEVGVGRVGEGAVRIEHERAVGDIARKRDRQRVAGIGIGVVEQHVAGDLCVFITRKCVIDRHRRIVDRGDGDRDGGGGAVIERVGEALIRRAIGVEVSIGRKAEIRTAIGDHHGTIGRLGDRLDQLRTGIDIGVVGQHIEGRRTAVLGHGEAVGNRHRRIVDRRHIDGRRGRGGILQAEIVDCCIAKAWRAIVVGIGHEVDAGRIAGGGNRAVQDHLAGQRRIRIERAVGGQAENAEA